MNRQRVASAVLGESIVLSWEAVGATIYAMHPNSFVVGDSYLVWPSKAPVRDVSRFELRRERS